MKNIKIEKVELKKKNIVCFYNLNLCKKYLFFKNKK